MALAGASVAVADDVYSSAPTFSPYYAGTVKSSVLNEALSELNYIRGLVGVPTDVTLNADFTSKAQHGAVLLDALDTLTHTPGKPADMSEEFYDLGYDATSHGNLSMGKISYGGKTYGNMTLSKSLKGCMDDSDAYNISLVGHRRWLMNPRLKQTGFGLSTRLGYAVTYVIEEGNNGNWPVNKEFITWPTAQHDHPLTYFSGSTAWCVVLNSGVYDKTTKSNVTVKLTRLSDNHVWNFSTSYKGGAFYVAENTVAYDECIIFRPDNVASYGDGERWRVEVSGLTRKDGGSGNISYTVKFTSAATGYDYDVPREGGSVTYGKKEDKGGGCEALGSPVWVLCLIFGIPRVRKLRVGK